MPPKIRPSPRQDRAVWWPEKIRTCAARVGALIYAPEAGLGQGTADLHLRRRGGSCHLAIRLDRTPSRSPTRQVALFLYGTHRLGYDAARFDCKARLKDRPIKGRLLSVCDRLVAVAMGWRIDGKQFGHRHDLQALARVSREVCPATRIFGPQRGQRSHNAAGGRNQIQSSAHPFRVFQEGSNAKSPGRQAAKRCLTCVPLPQLGTPCNPAP